VGVTLADFADECGGALCVDGARVLQAYEQLPEEPALRVGAAFGVPDEEGLWCSGQPL
jgi:hypothetical protein